MPEVAPIPRNQLARYAVLGTALAFAGPPIYIHLPHVYAEQHGMSLAAIGVVLLALRTIDFVQDPILGWCISRLQAYRWQIVMGSAVLLGASMIALFAVPPQFHKTVWLAISLIGVFTGFSALQIIYYSGGIELASRQKGGHEQVAAWRETGALIGICLACIAPSAFLFLVNDGQAAYALFSFTFAGLMMFAIVATRSMWQRPLYSQSSGSFLFLFRDTGVRQLLFLGFVNALPVGLTATLFVFFVDYRLEAAGHAGPLLLVLFISAASVANIWGQWAQRWGTMRVLRVGMVLAIVAFGCAALLRSGDILPFYIVSALSGMAVSADMTLLPALLAKRVERAAASREHAFALWGFVNKATLAVAAGTALPALGAAGFQPGTAMPETALSALTLAYAVLPCALKALSIAYLSILISRSEDKT